MDKSEIDKNLIEAYHILIKCLQDEIHELEEKYSALQVINKENVDLSNKLGLICKGMLCELIRKKKGMQADEISNIRLFNN